MGVFDEKLAGVDQALADLGKSEDEISELRGRCAGTEPSDLSAVDAELNALSDDVPVHDTPVAPAGPPSLRTEALGLEASADGWEDDHTEVEVIDESDFVLLVDENELDELERVGEEDALQVQPTSVPQSEDGEGDGFFKKLFGGNRRSSPPQP